MAVTNPGRAGSSPVIRGRRYGRSDTARKLATCAPENLVTSIEFVLYTVRVKKDNKYFDLKEKTKLSYMNHNLARVDSSSPLCWSQAQEKREGWKPHFCKTTHTHKTHRETQHIDTSQGTRISSSFFEAGPRD
nr:unnamed protein product [Callosobruchus chinensis]